jgi:hypothetical protein
MNVEWKASLVSFTAGAGKVTCEVRETTDTDIKFTAYFPADLAYLCPVNGDWSE